jgi:hypothetical protein
MEIGCMSLPMSWTAPRWFRTVPWTGCLVALGLWLRLYHYVRDPSMWHDEAALALNVIGKGFLSLLGPLLHAEAAPPLFLWLERGVTLILGDGTYALRLVPFLASCASLLLLVAVARRLLQARAVPWAVLLFACSDYLLWHACEAKPYAVDVLCAVSLVAIFVFTRPWPLGKQLLAYSLLAPPLILLVYPGSFLCGGLLLALLPAVWRARQRDLWFRYAALALLIAISFAFLTLGPARAQRCPVMTRCWVDQFAPWHEPWRVPLWTVTSTFAVGRYCCRPTGQALLVLAGIGAVLLWRRGQRGVVVLLTVPVALALVAAYLHAYPYGGVRVLVYATPAVVMLTGEGLCGAFDALRQRSRLGVAALGMLAVAPAAWTAYRVVVPWDRADCYGASAYVLAHRRPSDRVAGNHWEYEYYFRHLGPTLVSLSDIPQEAGARVWLVATGDTPTRRTQLAHNLPPGDWHPLEQREFAQTTVFLLERPGP